MSTLLHLFSIDVSFSPSVVADPAGIAASLGAHGIEYARWPVPGELPPEAGEALVLARHADESARVMAAFGYQSVDVVRMTPDHPQAAAARQKFLSEHTHADDEARFFAEGGGTFYLHLVEEQVVAALVCTAGDWVRVPAGTMHWFDMGTRPRFAAIRWFTRPDGWVAEFTGSTISHRFPTHDQLATV